MTIVEFLLARIEEDEAAARDAHYEGQTWIPEEEAVVAADKDLEAILFLNRKRDAVHAANWSPARVLAECAAKRLIIEVGATHIDQGARALGGGVDAVMLKTQAICAEFTLRNLATVYADHGDYQEEWKP